MSEDPDCLFCKIVAGEVPSDLVRETERTLAFRDINPQAPTHVLVVPKAHHPDAGALATADPEALAEILTSGAAIADDEGVPGHRIVFNTGVAAGQSVFHCHAHVLGGRTLEWPPG